MSKLLTDILAYLLWIVLGAGMAFFTFFTLAKSIAKLDPTSENTKGTAVSISLGRFLRFLLTAGLLLAAILWKVWYGLAFVVAFTLAVWALAVWHNRTAQLDAKCVVESEMKENV